MKETKSRILDAAERLIADHGLDVSLRTITAEAGVNLAAVNYHFQNKDSLWEAVVARFFEPINQRRAERLSALEAANPDGPLALEDVLNAFLEPLFEVAGKADEHFRPLMGRLYTAPDELFHKIFAVHIAPVVDRFAKAFARAVPHLDDEEVRWRMVFAIGVLVHLMNWSRVIPAISGKQLDPSDIEWVKHQVISFTAAGFRAPELKKEVGE